MLSTRSWLIFLLLLVVTSSCLSSIAAQETPTASELRELQGSLTQLFAAMKAGDVRTIENLFAGHMHGEYKVLLEQNRDYPEFLRNFYRGAKFTVVNITKTPEGYAIIVVAIELEGGSKSINRLRASRLGGANPGWKITDLLKEPLRPTK